MKHIRLVSLLLALVLIVGLFAACGKDGAPSGSASQPESDISMPESDTSAPGDLSQPETETPETPAETPEEKPVAPEAKPEQKPEQAPAPGDDTPMEVTPGQKPDAPAPEQTPEVPTPAGVDLNAFYQSIFPDPDNAPAMLPMDKDALDGFYPGLTSIATKQTAAYMPQMTAVPCEIVIVECANAADVDAVKAIFQARISAQVDNHFNYPMVIEAWEMEAKVVSNGNFVALFVVSGMTDQVVSNFNALF